MVSNKFMVKAQFRCEYKIVGDLVLPGSINNIEFGVDDDCKIVFKNGESNTQGHVIETIAIVVGTADSIGTAERQLREYLLRSLDLLSFVTHSRFKVANPIRLIEWGDGQKERQFKAYCEVDSRYPPDPELSKEFFDTVCILAKSNLPGYTRSALKFFRYGLLDDQPEDQFLRFWLALEVIAENLKDNSPIPISCPNCSAPLACKNCGLEPSRVPMAKKAIEQVIKSVAKEEAQEICKRQFDARNGLMHGSSITSIEKKCKMGINELVDELGKLAWHAIMSSITLPEKVSLNFGHRDGEFANKNLLLSAFGSFNHSSETDHPDENKLPNVNISMETSFKDKD